MCKKLLVLVLVLGIASTASARWWADFDNANATGLWEDALNWDCWVEKARTTPITPRQLPDYGHPDGAQAYIMGNTVAIVDGDLAGARGLFDDNKSAPSGNGLSVINQTGGQLHLNGYWFGESGSTAGGLYNISGGELLVDGMWGNALEIGNYTGSVGTLNVSGTGVVNALDGETRIGNQGASGYLNISGSGAVSTPDLAVDGGFNLDIADDGVLYLAGNKLEYFCSPGNGDARLYGAIMSGIMTANGSAGYALSDFVYWYDIGGDRTVIRVPEPATIALLGLGGLALIRRKR